METQPFDPVALQLVQQARGTFWSEGYSRQTMTALARVGLVDQVATAARAGTTHRGTAGNIEASKREALVYFPNWARGAVSMGIQAAIIVDAFATVFPASYSASPFALCQVGPARS